jgi:hypothetical protein
MHPNIYTHTYIYIYINLWVCVLHAYIYIHHPFTCMCENRSGFCMRAPVRDGDGSAVCARVGGLVLRARPKTLNPTPCEPFPLASTACRFGAQAFNYAYAFNANIGAWNTASVTTLERVCAAPGPAARTMADALGRASMRRVARCARRHCRCARACEHVQALACAGAWV